MTRIFFLIVLFLSFGYSQQEIFRKEIFFSNSRVRINSENFPAKPKIGLVLSGGGARGLAHLGVLRVLNEYDIQPDLIMGTSIGSVIGGLYAAGYTIDEIDDIIHTIEWSEIFSDSPQRSYLFLEQKNEQDRYLVSLRLDGLKPYIPNAVSPGQRVLSILYDLFIQADYQVRENFDDLKIPFRTIATDIVNGEMVILKDGNIAEAINGSLAVPLLFSPVNIDSMLLVDGGLKSNLPVNAARSMGMDVIIAVDVSSPLRNKDQIKAPWEIADQVTTIMSEQNNLKERDNADILIIPKIGIATNIDFSKIDTLVNAGIKAARQKIEQFIELKSRHISNGRKLKVEKINFMGIDNFSRDSLYTNSMDSLISLSYLDVQLNRLLQKGDLKSIQVVYDSSDFSLSLSLIPFGRVDSVNIAGNTLFTNETIKDSLGVKNGQPLNWKILQQGIGRIIRLYRDNGYALMTIDTISWNANILNIEISEGVIADIKVIGNSKTKDFIILREFTLQKNDVFNWNRVDEGLKNVYASEYFNRISAEVIKSNEQIDLKIKVDEKPTVRFQLGGKADIERRFQGYMELADENFLGRGLKGKIETRLGVRDGLVGLSFRSDRLFTTYLTFTANSYFTWESNPFNKSSENDGRYREERLGFKLQLGQQLRRIGQVVAEIRVERVKDFQQNGFFDRSEELELRVFSLRSVTDKRDRIDFPTKGIYNYWAWESGSSFLLNSEESYTKLWLNLEGYYRLFNPDHIGHVRFLAGLGDETLPFSENFRMGGLKGFYGLLENELFGKQIVLINSEYRYKLPFKIITDAYLSVRYDFAGLWSSKNLIFSSDDFFSGYGAYLGFDTFLGPFFIAWGENTLDRRNIYLSLGFDF